MRQVQPAPRADSCGRGRNRTQVELRAAAATDYLGRESRQRPIAARATHQLPCPVVDAAEKHERQVLPSGFNRHDDVLRAQKPLPLARRHGQNRLGGRQPVQLRLRRRRVLPVDPWLAPFLHTF